MRELELYRPCIRGALAEGWGLTRLDDLSPGKKPGDILGCARDGKAVLLELKIYDGAPKTFQELPWRQFADHQKAWLSFYAQKGAYALAGIYYVATEMLIIYRLREPCMEQHLTHELHHQHMVYHREAQVFTGWNGLLYTLESPF